MILGFAALVLRAGASLGVKQWLLRGQGRGRQVLGPLGAPPRLLGLLLRLSVPQKIDELAGRLRGVCFTQGGLDGSLHGGLIEVPRGAKETEAFAQGRDVANKKMSGHGGVVTTLFGCSVRMKPMHGQALTVSDIKQRRDTTQLLWQPC